VHIALDEAVVDQIDRVAGPRRRSAYIAEAVRRALEEDRRWELIWSGVGSISDPGHDWDDDPAAWVREQRHADARRVG
jgi:hypothetical protein